MSLPCYHCFFFLSIFNLSLFMLNSLLSRNGFLLHFSPLKLLSYFSTLFPIQRCPGMGGEQYLPLSITLVSPCAQVRVHRPVEPKPPEKASFLQFTFLDVSAVFDHVEFCITINFFGPTRPLVFRTLLYLASFPTSLIFDSPFLSSLPPAQWIFPRDWIVTFWSSLSSLCLHPTL